MTDEDIIELTAGPANLLEKEEIAALKAEIAELKEENDRLRGENSRLSDQLANASWLAEQYRNENDAYNRGEWR
jgi:regulator of replication initiation timing